MAGGWTMSMAWMPMPGHTWLGAAASFIGMWVVMMVAMMLPSFVPTLWRYRQAVDKAGEMRLSWLIALLAIGYFVVWSVFGIVVFPLGATLAEIEMQQPALARVVPTAAGVVVVIAGALQFSAWKAHHLACCQERSGRSRSLPADAATAWRHAAPRPPLHLRLRWLYGDPPRHRHHGSAGYGSCHGSNHCRTARIEERVARAIGFVVAGIGLLLIATATAGLG